MKNFILTILFLFSLVSLQAGVILECDTLYTNNTKLVVQVLEVNDTEISYVHCGESAPIYYTYKRDVSSISYYNGRIERFTLKSVDKHIDRFALMGFIMSIFGLSLIATTFSLIGLFRIKSSNNKLGGKGFAWTGIILGIITSALTLIILFVF